MRQRSCLERRVPPVLQWFGLQEGFSYYAPISRYRAKRATTALAESDRRTRLATGFALETTGEHGTDILRQGGPTIWTIRKDRRDQKQQACRGWRESLGFDKRFYCRWRAACCQNPVPFSRIFFLAPIIAACAASEIPVEDFCRAPEISEAKMSDGGEEVAFVMTKGDERTLHYQDLKTHKVFNIKHMRGGQSEDVAEFRWIGPGRLAYLGSETFDEEDEKMHLNSLGKRSGVIRRYLTGWSAMDVGGGRWITLTGIDRETDNDLLGMNILSILPDGHSLLVTEVAWRNQSMMGQYFPNVTRIDHLTGQHEIVEKNPGNITQWLVDRDGNLRFACVLKGTHVRYLYRETSTVPWREFSRDDEVGRQMRPLAFDFDGKGIFVKTVNAAGFWSLARFDLGNESLEEIQAAAGYDVLPPESLGTEYDGLSLESLLSSQVKRRVVGVRFMTDRPHVRWFDPARARVQADVDTALPGVVNTIVSVADDQNLFLVLSWSDRSPGAYYLYNYKNASLQKFGERMPWIKPEEMAAMRPLAFKARDGLPLHGYVTLPPRRPPGPHPTVMLVHGGPWARDAWGFEPMVQFLASRGYAVLQVNYRGSTGFGVTAFEQARRQVGGAIQDDITDTVRWAVREKIAEPGQIAIMGASYGGYSALWGATNTPELYRCAIDISGPSDWYRMIGDSKERETPFAHDYWTERIGDFKLDAGRLKEISPVNHVRELQAPVLVIQGAIDKQVPETQARELIDELRSGKKTYDSLFFPDEEHGIVKEVNRAREYRAIEGFLKKYMPSEPTS